MSVTQRVDVVQKIKTKRKSYSFNVRNLPKICTTKYIHNSIKQKNVKISWCLTKNCTMERSVGQLHDLIVLSPGNETLVPSGHQPGYAPQWMWMLGNQKICPK